MNCAILRHIKKFKTSLTTISELRSNKKQPGQNIFYTASNEEQTTVSLSRLL